MKINHITNAELDMLLGLADFASNEADYQAILECIADPFNQYLIEDLQALRLAKNSPKVEYSKPTVYYVYEGGIIDDFGLVVEKRLQTKSGNRWIGAEQISKQKLDRLFDNKLISECDFVEALHVFNNTTPTTTQRLDNRAEGIEERKRLFKLKLIGKRYKAKRV